MDRNRDFAHTQPLAAARPAQGVSSERSSAQAPEATCAEVGRSECVTLTLARRSMILAGFRSTIGAGLPSCGGPTRTTLTSPSSIKRVAPSARPRSQPSQNKPTSGRVPSGWGPRGSSSPISKMVSNPRRAAWWIDADTGNVVPIAGFKCPRIQSWSHFSDGGFVVLATDVMAFDNRGRQTWTLKSDYTKREPARSSTLSAWRRRRATKYLCRNTSPPKSNVSTAAVATCARLTSPRRGGGSRVICRRLHPTRMAAFLSKIPAVRRPLSA